MTDTNTTASDRLEEAVGTISVPEPKTDTESLLMKAALVLPILGLVLIVLAAYQAGGTAYTADQIPMLISGGILGLALVILGVGVFIRFSMARTVRTWMGRMVLEQQVQTERLNQTLAAIEASASRSDR